MKCLVIGDPHFKVTNAAETQEMASRILKEAVKSQPHFVVVLGDILDTKDRISMTPLLLATDFLKSLQDIAPLYIVIGNHDRRHDKVFLTLEHPFTALKYWTNTTVCDVVKHVIINNMQFTFVPYVEAGRFQEALDTSPGYEASTCIFAHQEFKGAQMGPIVSTNGDIWDKNNCMIISGHIHEYQELQNNILYIGTPIQHNYDTCYEKFIGLFYFNQPYIKSHSDLLWDKISLNMPIKKEIHLSASAVTKYKLEKNVLTKLVITGTHTEIKTLLKNPKLNEWRKKGIKIVYKYAATEKLLTCTDKVDVKSNFSHLFYNTIKDIQELESLYTELFGNS